MYTSVEEGGQEGGGRGRAGRRSGAMRGREKRSREYILSIKEACSVYALRAPPLLFAFFATRVFLWPSGCSPCLSPLPSPPFASLSLSPLWTGLHILAMDLHNPPRPGQPSRVAPLHHTSPRQPASPLSPSTSRTPQPLPHRFAHIQDVYDEKAHPTQLHDLQTGPRPGLTTDMSPIAGPSSLSRSQASSPSSSIPPWIRSQRMHHPRPSQYNPPFSPAPCPIASSWASPSASSLSSSPYASSISPSYTLPRSLRIANIIKPWIPIILYAITTLGFLVAVSFWKVEVFQGKHLLATAIHSERHVYIVHVAIAIGLDDLSRWLKSDTYQGYAVIFALIFITTIREYSRFHYSIIRQFCCTLKALSCDPNFEIDMSMPYR